MTRREEEEIVTFDDVICKHSTAKAILVTIENEDYWIPVSQLAAETEVSTTGDCGTLAVTAWIAREKGLL